MGRLQQLPPEKSNLNGNYRGLPSGTQLPEGLGFIQDGKYHGTIFPTRDMTVDEFNTLYNSLLWFYGGSNDH